MISERDYARKVILQGKASKQTQVREIMSAPAFTVTAAYTADDCLRIMSARRIHHLPVVDQDGIVGMLSISDLVLSTMSMQAYTIEQLETYIGSKYPK
jgi:CBS domain-containing protein